MEAQGEKRSFWWQVAICAFGCYIAGMTALGLAGRFVFGDAAHFERLIGLLQTPASVLGIAIVARVWRRRGLSQERHNAETLVADSGPPPRHEGAPVRLQASRGVYALCGAMFSAMAGGGYMLARSPSPEFARTGYVGLLFFGVPALVSWFAALTTSRFSTEANEEGITKRSLLKSRRRHIAWDEVASCTITTGTDILGNALSPACALIGHSGQELLRIRFGDVPKEQRNRFLEVLRSTHAASVPPELMSAKPPPGLGTEPAAAAAPAGRGTEPAAGPPAEGVRDRLR